MRYEPDAKYNGMPCSYAGTGCTYEDVTKKDFDLPQLISQGANDFSHLGEWHFLFAYF